MLPSHPRRPPIGRSQNQLLLTQAACYGLFLLMLTIGLFGPFVIELSRGEPGTGPGRSGMTRAMLFLHARSWLLLGGVSAVAVLHSLFLARRIAGPLAELRRALRDVAAGHLVPALVPRRRDLFAEEAWELNAASASLGARVLALRATHARALDELRALERALQVTPGPAASLEVLRTRIDELGHELAWFDCGDRDAALRVDVEGPPSLVAEPRRASEAAELRPAS